MKNASFPDPPIQDKNRTSLQLSNGKWLYLRKGDWEKKYDKVEFLYGRGRWYEKKKDIIWSKVYETDDRRATQLPRAMLVDYFFKSFLLSCLWPSKTVMISIDAFLIR